MGRELLGWHGEGEKDVVHDHLDRGEMQAERVDVGVVDRVSNGAVGAQAFERLSDLDDRCKVEKPMSEV